VVDRFLDLHNFVCTACKDGEEPMQSDFTITSWNTSTIDDTTIFSRSNTNTTSSWFIGVILVKLMSYFIYYYYLDEAGLTTGILNPGSRVTVKIFVEVELLEGQFVFSYRETG
jgi:hypothetical protein